MKPFAGSVLLFLLGSAVAVGLAEGVVRLADPHARDHVIPSGFFIIDRVLGWRLRPDAAVTHRTRYFTATYTTNSAGDRDRARPAARRADRTRILLYGESEIFGWGVADSLRFSELLETRHPELEMWNLGVPAYGLDQQVIAYEETGRGPADVVGFFVSPATLMRSETGYLFRKHKPRFVLTPAGDLELVPIPGQATQWTAALYRLFSPNVPAILSRKPACRHQEEAGEPSTRGGRPSGPEERPDQAARACHADASRRDRANVRTPPARAAGAR